jgi:hypothetical protein
MQSKNSTNARGLLHRPGGRCSGAGSRDPRIGDLITDGTIIVFDEIFNFPNWQRTGEYKAFVEFIEASGLQYEFIGYIRHSVQMAIKIKA